MDKKLIEYNITIAIAMLESTRTDRYGNGKIRHFDRNFVTATVTNLLNDILWETRTDDVLIIPKKQLTN